MWRWRWKGYKCGIQILPPGKFFNEKYEAKLEFLGVRRVQNKKTFHGMGTDVTF